MPDDVPEPGSTPSRRNPARGEGDAQESPPGVPAEAGAPRHLRVVSYQHGCRAVESALRLVREYKGPTVRDVLRAGVVATSRLPGRVCSVLTAIERGDFAAANASIDDTAKVIPGPGARPASSPPFAASRRLFALWLLATVVLLLAWWLA